MWSKLVFIGLIFVPLLVSGNPDAKRLYDDLLSSYNKLVRPVVNTSDVLRVSIKLKLSQLIDVVSVSYLSKYGLLIFFATKGFQHWNICNIWPVHPTAHAPETLFWAVPTLHFLQWRRSSPAPNVQFFDDILSIELILKKKIICCFLHNERVYKNIMMDTL